MLLRRATHRCALVLVFALAAVSSAAAGERSIEVFAGSASKPR